MKETERFPVKLSEEGRKALREASTDWDMPESEIVRLALKLLFQARGREVDFSPGQHGGKREHPTERDMIGLVMERIKALGLPTPKQDYRVRQHTYDLAWPEQKAAVEIRLKWRESEPGWTVVHIAPGMGKAAIDRDLKDLFERE